MKPSLQNLYELQATLIDIPAFLTQYRKIKRITQEELANELAITPKSISADEQGRYSNASLDRLLQVVNALIRLSNHKTIEENKHEIVD